MKRLLYGKGVNDANYSVSRGMKGKRAECPYYIKWSSMIERCYSLKFQKRSPAYKGCTVSEAWLTFSNFKAWMIGQDYEGKVLDKDILVPGNKIYGPDVCLFIPQDINKLLTDRKSDRGIYPQGVVFHKVVKKFQAQIMKYGKKVHIGYYENPEQAESAYIKAKAAHIRNVAEKQIHRIAEALRRHATLLEAKLV